MKSNASLLYSFFLFISDFLALVLAFIGAYILRVSLGVTLGPTTAISRPLQAETYILIFIALVPFWILIFAMLGLYSSSIYEKRFAEAGRLFMGSFVGLLFVLGFAYAANDTIFPAKLIPVYGFVLAFIFLVIFRNLVRLGRSLLFRYHVGLSNVLIIGNTPVAAELVESLRNSAQSGYQILGLVGARENSKLAAAHIPSYPDFQAALSHIDPSTIHGIVQTELYGDSTRNNEVLDYAQQHHIAYRFVPGNSELFVGKLEVELFRNSVPVITVHQTALIGWGRVVKRIFDLVVGGILLLIASPFMIIIGVLDWIINRGVFYRQERLTRFNSVFKVYKFQTVKPSYNGLSPEEAFTKMGKPELIKQYRDNGDKLDKDPRYGTYGNFLRKFSLDELPQLINVVKGDISLVGPRALVPDELNKYEKRHAVLSVKSGLTGLAQVSGRRSLSFEERRKLDIYYVQNWSFWFDIVIMLKTIRVVLTGAL